MNQRLNNKLKDLPLSPGVYFHKSKTGEIIYVGKAAKLRNRVRHYFQESNNQDPKTQALIKEITDFDWMVVDSEIEALFLEAEMIRRYRPRYNILLRDDRSMIYLRIDYTSDYPTVTTTRRPLDDKAKYFGPFLSAYSLNQALRVLRRIFPYATRRPSSKQRVSLYYHIGLDPGLEEGKTNLKDYRANLRKLIAVISGKKQQVLKELKVSMKSAAKDQDFEAAANYRNQLVAIENLGHQVIFSDKEFQDITKDHALAELTDILSLKAVPRRIEAYDISHMQGSDVVASMVVFTNGLPDKRRYRKFKMRQDQNNDFLNMHVTIKRRFKDNHLSEWGQPDLVLIDGGKGQLDAAIKARDEKDKSSIPFIGLAKRQEQIVVSNTNSMVNLNFSKISKLSGYIESSEDFSLINLPLSSNAVKLLQRIRDESHRFAVSYHSTLKTKRQTTSLLDSIPGIGPATKRKLQKEIGGIKTIANTPVGELVKLIGKAKTDQLKKHL